MPSDLRLGMHPVRIATWGEAAFHVRWHLREARAGRFPDHDHPHDAFASGPLPDQNAYVIDGANPDEGTIRLVFWDDHRVGIAKPDDAQAVADALAAGQFLHGVIGGPVMVDD